MKITLFRSLWQFPCTYEHVPRGPVVRKTQFHAVDDALTKHFNFHFIQSARNAYTEKSNQKLFVRKLTENPFSWQWQAYS